MDEAGYQRQLTLLSDRELIFALRDPVRANRGIGGYYLLLAEGIARLLEGRTAAEQVGHEDLDYPELSGPPR